MVKRFKIPTMFLALWILITGCQMGYVGRVGYHQLRFIMARQPVEQVLEEDFLSAEQKEKIALILAAKSFAEDKMGLKPTRNYTQYVQLDRSILAYILTAAYKDRLESRQWWFPVLGSFPYKGFFDLQALERERLRLEQEEDLDTFVQLMAAYSTLGWFLDPIFSTYLQMKTHDLADMVIHESVHLTLFVKRNMPFNEQMATFLGRMGAIEFLEYYRGPQSVEAREARNRWADDILFSRWLNALTTDLRKLYEQDIPREEKLRRREILYGLHQDRFQQVAGNFRTDEYLWLHSAKLNNAVILSLLTYMENLDLFHRAYESMGGDLSSLVNVLKRVSTEKGDSFENLRHAIAEFPGPGIPPCPDSAYE